MKKLFITLFIMCCIVQSYAQKSNLSKEELKNLKAELKAYLKDPNTFAEYQENQTNTLNYYAKMNDSMAGQLKDLNKKSAEQSLELTKMQEDITANENKMTALVKANTEAQDSIVKMQESITASNQLLKAKLSLSKPKTKAVALKTTPTEKKVEAAVKKEIEAEPVKETKTEPSTPTPGTTFKIQIGNYSVFSAEGFDGDKTMETESTTGSKKYVVGNFTTKDAAKKVKDDLKKLGINDAFIVEYVNGERVKK
jgi:cell division protein FtsN